MIEETIINTEPTFIATIYIGLKQGYTGQYNTKDKALQLIQNYVDTVKLCVTVKDTVFLYSNGNETGLEVGLINYPRFPIHHWYIIKHAKAIAEILMKELCQNRVTIVTSEDTYMLTNSTQYD